MRTIRRRARRFRDQERRDQFRLPHGLIVAALAVATASSARADDLDAYLNAPTHRALTERVIDAYEGPRRGRCAQTRIIGTKATVLRPVSFDGNGVPRDGAWREATLIDRCGRRVRHNVTIVVEGGVLTPLGMAPGETRVPQADQDMLATMAVNRLQDRAPTPSCDAFVIFDTKAAGSARDWRETWTIDRCGQRDNVRFDLRMDDDRMRAGYADP